MYPTNRFIFHANSV